MKNIFIAVDLQNDFMNRDGLLYVQGSEEIKPALKKFINWILENKENTLIYTRDVHYPNDSELSENPDYVNTFPQHCMASTAGSQIIPEGFGLDSMDEIMSGNCNIVSFVKNQFSIFEANDELLKYLIGFGEINDIYVFGVAGDICVRGVMDGLFKHKESQFNFNRLIVVEDCIASVNSEMFNSYLTEKVLQYDYIKVLQSNNIINNK